ncbi:DUF4352 domain-containing protein [Raineyella fluvialis]|nr:DUF4352 domain-containing protein [Raineyella fluvialis]
MSQPPFPQSQNPQYQNQPYQQVPGQPYPPQPPMKPRKKWYKRPWVWVVTVIVIIAFAANGGGNKGAKVTAGSTASQAPAAASSPLATTPVQASTQAVAPAAKQEEKLAGLNEAVDAGDLQYTVTKVQKGVSKVGSDYLNQSAQGQYVLVSVNVKNTGKSSKTFDSNLVKLYDKDAIEYSSDSTAEIYANDQNHTFLEQVNPGNTVKGLLVFDIPKDVQPTQLGVRGGMFGAEKKISLS